MHRLGIVIALAAAALPISITAQQAGDAPPVEYDVEPYLEEVIVTGTRIARRDFTTPSPLTTVDHEFIEFTNQPTLEDTLNQMPQVFPAYGRASNNPGDGTAQIDLRGLGAGRSLVLLNGRRVAPSGTGNAVDLNNIPRFLIERVEIITGGTSAVYGSDAIAGVVNFITRRNFTGVGLEAGYGVSEQGDAENFEFNAAWGRDFAGGAGNVAVFANYLDREPLLAVEREFTRYPWFDDWDQGILVTGGSSIEPAGKVNFPLVDFGQGPAQTTFDPDGTPREFLWPQDAYNWAPVNYLQIPMTRYAVGAMGYHEIAGDFEAYFEAGFTRNETGQNMAAVPARIYVAVNLDNPVLAPETREFFAEHYICDDNLACFSFSRRMLEVGERVMALEQDYTRVLAGVRGNFAGDWTVDGWLTWTNNDSSRYLRNDLSRSRFQQGLLVDPATGQCYDPSGGCVPVDVFGEGKLSPEGADFLRFVPYENVTERTFWLASGYVSGSPIDTWAGPLDMAFGAEWRSDDTRYRADEALFSGDAMGYGGSAPVDGTERIWELYAEALVPLLEGKKGAEQLELELGVRYTKGNYAEGYWTYKAGFSWEIIAGLTGRAMHQRSMRSPNSQELFEQQGTSEGFWISANSARDPCSASADPVGSGVVDKCLIQGLQEDQIGVFEATGFYPVDYYWGGNPDLVPEEGKTWTAGVVLQPEALPDWVFTVDYFEMEVTDTIGEIIADLICFDALNTGNLFCENLVRDASGNVAEIWELTSNRGRLKTRGVDTQVQFRSDLPDWMALPDSSADFFVNLYWTHLLSLQSQENPATEIYECAGLFSIYPCINASNPENKVTTQFNYQSGAFEAQVTWRWIDGMDNGALKFGLWGAEDANIAIEKIPDRHYFDLGLVYTFDERYQLRFGVSNLLDEGPVMMADYVWDKNTDVNLYDVFGRSYNLRLSAKF